jgi:hypothetical protein
MGERKTKENAEHRVKGGAGPLLAEQEQEDRRAKGRRYRHMDRLERLKEEAGRFLQAAEGSRLKEAGTELAAAHLYEVLLAFEPGRLGRKLQNDPALYVRLVSTLAGLGETELKYLRYRAEVAEQKAVLERELNAARKDSGLRPESLAAIENALSLL